MSFETPGFAPVVVTVAVMFFVPLTVVPSAGLVIQTVTEYAAEAGLLLLQLFPAARVSSDGASVTRLIPINTAMNTLNKPPLRLGNRSSNFFIISPFLFKFHIPDN